MDWAVAMDTKRSIRRVSKRTSVLFLAAAAASVIALYGTFSRLSGGRHDQAPQADQSPRDVDHGASLHVSAEEIRVPATEARELRREGKKARGTFIVSNVGTENLHVRLHHSQCSCSVPDFGNERTLEPGEQTPLTIEAAVPPAGEVTAVVDLLIDSTHKPRRLRLVVEGGQELPSVHRVWPRSLLFHGDHNSEMSLTVYLETFETSDGHWIQSSRCDVTALAVGPPIVETTRMRDSNVVLRKYRFQVTLHDSATEARGAIQLLAGESEAPVVSIDVRVEPTAPIRIAPRPLMVRISPDEPSTTKKVIISSPAEGGEDFRVDIAKSQFPDWLTASVANRAPGVQTLELTVTKPPTTVDKYDLVLATNNSRYAEVHIPIHLMRQSSASTRDP